MNKQNLTVVGVIVALVFAAVAAFKSPAEKVIEKVIPAGNVTTLDGVDSPYASIGGSKMAYVSSGVVATSSTICSIKNPYNATSTVVRAGLFIASGPTASNNVSLSTSTNNYATSSPFLVLDAALPAGGVSSSIYWNDGVSSTTQTRILAGSSVTGQSQIILRGGEYLNWRIATTTAAGALGTYYVGSCTAEVHLN